VKKTKKKKMCSIARSNAIESATPVGKGRKLGGGKNVRGGKKQAGWQRESPLFKRCSVMLGG